VAERLVSGQPLMVVDQGLRWSASAAYVLLEGVPGGRSPSAPGSATCDRSAAALLTKHHNRRVESAIDLGAYRWASSWRVVNPEARTLPDELLDGDVDDVGQISFV